MIDISTYEQRVADAAGFLHIAQKREELAALDAEIADPGFWDDTSRAQQVSKQASNLRDTIAEYEKAAATLDDARTALELAGEDPAFEEEAQAALEARDWSVPEAARLLQREQSRARVAAKAARPESGWRLFFNRFMGHGDAAVL
jgi:protein subunit release factor A